MSKFRWWATLPASEFYVPLSSIALGVAKLQHPTDELRQTIATAAIRKSLRVAITRGFVTVRNPTEGYLPVEGNLPMRGGVIDRDDLRNFLRECGVGLHIPEPLPSMDNVAIQATLDALPEPLRGVDWLTYSEASGWLKEHTAEDWPLPRLIASGVDVSIWLEPGPDISAEVLDAVFAGRHQGIRVEVYDGHDRERLKFERTSGVLTTTRRPDGTNFRIIPPLQFKAEDLKFQSASVQRLAAVVRHGVYPEHAPPMTIHAGDSSYNVDDPGFAARVTLNGGPECLIGGMLQPVRFTELPIADRSVEQPPASIDNGPAGARAKDALPDWKARVQAEAAAHWIRLLATGCQPSVHGIVKSINKWCAENDIRTTTRVIPSSNYLREHVLGAKHWKPPNMTRAQAKKHVAQAAQVAQVAQASVAQDSHDARQRQKP